MKRHIKLFVFLGAIIAVFAIYKTFSKESNKINYIALGDSVAEGMNSYGEIVYGYPDYISDYLKENERLTFYTKGFSKSGYTTENVKNDIENNKTIEVDGKKVNIKEALRESDLVTISIGANDFIKHLEIIDIPSKLTNLKESKKEIDAIGIKVKELLILIKKYAKNQIILVSYYNPLPALQSVKSEIDELIKYANNVYEDICDDLDITYVNVFDIFDGNDKYLPNPIDIHPTTEGYKEIANRIIKEIE